VSDVHKDQRQAGAATDALYQPLALVSVQACAGWAHTQIVDTLDVLLWPRDRGDFPQGPPYRVTSRIVERGIWRITLCAIEGMPEGVDFATREAIVKASIAHDAMLVPSKSVDKIVQCGLFGEVLYR
jgi:hypothetical protein